jgi:hypothetical protein
MEMTNASVAPGRWLFDRQSKSRIDGRTGFPLAE